MIKFEVEDKQFEIRMPPKTIAEAKKVHTKAFADNVKAGALFRQGLMIHMKEQGLWSETKEAEYHAYLKKIADLEHKLSSGGLKISEGRKLAIELSEARADFRDLMAQRTSMDSNTVEGLADQARFDFLLVKSVYSYDTQKPVFASVDEYLEKGSEPLSEAIARKFANYVYGVDENYDRDRIENKFLRRFKMIDDNGRYIDKEGNFVDVDGNRVDAEGYRIDADGKRLDINLHVIDESLDVEKAEFLED
jgi:hypothetical protein